MLYCTNFAVRNDLTSVQRNNKYLRHSVTHSRSCWRRRHCGIISERWIDTTIYVEKL